MNPADERYDMSYEYSGYLSTVLCEPDTALLESDQSITFGPSDIEKWGTRDFDHALEWQSVPVTKTTTDEGVKLEGHFQNVVNIDSLSQDDPRYWVALSTIGLNDSRFPINTTKYPVIEVTYRCTSEYAHPTWMWTYKGGSHFGALPKSKEWHTVARNVQPLGFPEHIDDVILRLYSPRRTIESMEIASVRFRAMSEAETEATRKSLSKLETEQTQQRYPVLDTFMPLGVYMDAEVAKRLASMLGISQGDYWDLVMEDLVMHNHNAIALANIDRMGSEDLEDLLWRCERHGIKVLPRHDYPVGGDEEAQTRVLDECIRPTAQSNAIFARMFSGEPIESDFAQVLEAKRRMEEADPNHPVAIVARYPNAYPLFAPFFAASGIGYFVSKRPWDAGKAVRAHVPLSDNQQFWLAAPAFMYPTQTPPWSTCPEMRLMFNLAFANGARGWFSYFYHNDPVWLRGRVQRTLTGSFLTFSDLWMELMQRMKWAGALAPLLLQARIEDAMDDWYVDGISTDSTGEPMAGLGPISKFHLRGGDFSLYFTVSNYMRDMTSVEIDIPKDAAEGMQIYDLSEFVTAKTWEPFERKRHVEMFPGQAHIMLVASPDRCEEWRNTIAKRLIDSDLRKMQFGIELAQAYNLDIGGIEADLERLDGKHGPEDLDIAGAAMSHLTDLTYETASIREARSGIIEASSAVCGCDGGLCRLMQLGKRERAIELGREVVPLAAEFTRLRLELRRGKGAEITKQSKELAARGLAVLRQIRAEYEY